MVLHPLEVSQSATLAKREGPLPAWLPIAEKQKQRAAAYWLISQPDHASLSGDLAANFVSPRFPRVEPLLARAIGVHDSGWAIFEPEAAAANPPRLTADGKPLSFIEFEPQEFLRAWTASIDRAEQVCPAGGIIVSRHFWDLGDFRLKDGKLRESDRQLILKFQERERSRQQRLLPGCSDSSQRLDGLLEVLKFCDLLSLYLCSGAQQEVEFTNRMVDGPVRVCWSESEQLYRLDPSPFQREGGPRLVNVGVTARYFPVNGNPKLKNFTFLLA
jgi:hypothetical protein